MAKWRNLVRNEKMEKWKKDVFGIIMIFEIEAMLSGSYCSRREAYVRTHLVDSLLNISSSGFPVNTSLVLCSWWFENRILTRSNVNWSTSRIFNLHGVVGAVLQSHVFGTGNFCFPFLDFFSIVCCFRFTFDWHLLNFKINNYKQINYMHFYI